MHAIEEARDANAGSLWERFHRELFAFLRARVGSEAAAQDILQNAFLRAHKHLSSGEPPENPRAWLYQIVRNLIIDAHRRGARDAAIAEAVAQESEAPDTIDPPASIEEDAFAAVARALPMFIDALDGPHRDALYMTEIEGLTQAEAAERAGLSLSGMKSRVQRGRKRIFDSLQRCCEFELDGRGRMIACEPRAADKDCC